MFHSILRRHGRSEPIHPGPEVVASLWRTTAPAGRPAPGIAVGGFPLHPKPGGGPTGVAGLCWVFPKAAKDRAERPCATSCAVVCVSCNSRHTVHLAPQRHAGIQPEFNTRDGRLLHLEAPATRASRNHLRALPDPSTPLTGKNI